jgi:hypothetical protein
MRDLPRLRDTEAISRDNHLLPFLPHMKVPVEDVIQAKSKMTISSRAFFAARRKDGPVHPCCCCRRTWFKRSVHQVTQEFEEKISTKLRVHYTGTTDHEGVRRLCNSCYMSFKKRKAPKMCTQNFPDLPKIPAELVGMTEMENHLVAPRIPFMKIYIMLPRGGQRGVHGGMVNVSSNLTKI